MDIIKTTTKRIVGAGGDEKIIGEELRKFGRLVLKAGKVKVKAKRKISKATLGTYLAKGPTNNGVVTSKAAAVSIKGQQGQIRQQVLNFIIKAGAKGATADEVEVGLGYGGNTIRPRLKELEAANRIMRQGDTRLTRAKREALIWRS